MPRSNATSPITQNESGFIVERAVNGGPFSVLANLPARNGQGNVTYVDTTVVLGNTYAYRVASRNAFVMSAYTNTASMLVSAPTAPLILTATAARQGNNNERITVTWTGSTPGVTSYTIQWSATNWGVIAGSSTVGANLRTFTSGNIARQIWYVRVGATNAVGTTWFLVRLVPAAP